MNHDYHVHSTYSDGSDMAEMVEAAAEAGLDGVGFTDHANVSTDEPGTSLPHDFAETYGERRADIRELRDRFDVRIFDGIELDYRPKDEERIESFLDEAGFEYAIGSVHHVGLREVMSPAEFEDDSETDRAEFVDQYFETVTELIDSELYDIVGHVDVIERNPHLRDLATEEHYRDVAEALTESRSVPELNAGRVFRGYSEIHPHPEFLDVLTEHGVEFVTGTDAHTPMQLRDRSEYLASFADERNVETRRLV